MWRNIFMYSCIHIRTMYKYCAADRPMNLEPWIRDWYGLWNVFLEMLRNKKRMLLWVINKIYLIYIVPMVNMLYGHFLVSLWGGPLGTLSQPIHCPQSYTSTVAEQNANTEISQIPTPPITRSHCFLVIPRFPSFNRNSTKKY